MTLVLVRNVCSIVLMLVIIAPYFLYHAERVYWNLVYSNCHGVMTEPGYGTVYYKPFWKQTPAKRLVELVDFGSGRRVWRWEYGDRDYVHPKVAAAMEAAYAKERRSKI